MLTTQNYAKLISKVMVLIPRVLTITVERFYHEIWTVFGWKNSTFDSFVFALVPDFLSVIIPKWCLLQYFERQSSCAQRQLANGFHACTPNVLPLKDPPSIVKPKWQQGLYQAFLIKTPSWWDLNLSPNAKCFWIIEENMGIILKLCYFNNF